MRSRRALLWVGICVLGLVGVGRGVAEVCTTQSAMSAADRDALATAVRDVASKVQADDVAGLQKETVAEFATNFAPMQGLMATTFPRLKGASLELEQVFLLDGAEIKAGGGDAQFFCTLNKSPATVEFLIPGLTAGLYGFGDVLATGAGAPVRLPMLLRKDGGRWLLAGIYPRATQAAGHDGVWYWTEARRLKAAKEPWDAWLYYGEAEALLKPANFVLSTHLEKLRDEQKAGAPPALSDGVAAETPLVVKGTEGTEFQFTALGVDDSLGKEKVDVAAHLKVAALGDAVAARKRNEDAMRALLAAYPEMRQAFHGVWIISDVAGASPFATEEPMSDLH